jgi:hypothetical protein
MVPENGNESMKCPLCGADNAERAEKCYLCEYSFTEGGVTGEPPGPGEPGQSQYPPPAILGDPVPPGPQAVPPPPAPGSGYQPPPPGAYPPGYQPVPPAGGSRNTKVIIGVVVGVAVLIAAAAIFFFATRKTYSINVPQPPGYTEASDALFKQMEDGLSSSSDKIALDALYVDSGIENLVIVAHQDVPFSDAPSGDDPDEMERYFYDNKADWVKEFNTGLMEGSGMDAELDLYEVERLATGDAALHMVTSIDSAQGTFRIDSLWIIKGNSSFVAIIEGLNPRGEETVEFLKENITFSD